MNELINQENVSHEHDLFLYFIHVFQLAIYFENGSVALSLHVQEVSPNRDPCKRRSLRPFTTVPTILRSH